jgi:hypothetical protein
MTAQDINISGNTSFNQTGQQIISDALQLLGVVGGGTTTSSNDETFCLNILNKMIKAWQAQGIHLFTESEVTIPLTTGVGIMAFSSTGIEQSTYPESIVMGNPLDIQSLRYFTYQGAEVRMRKFGRAQFMEIPNKLDQANSTCFYFSPQDTYALLYIWPIPNNSVDTLTASYTRIINDFTTDTNTPDFPVAWLDALTYNLAVKVAPAFGIALSKVNPDLTQMAQSSLAEMRTWDSENGSIFIVPDYRWDR